MQMPSTVGVLLDEIPAGALREKAASEALAQPTSFWRARAERQVRLTYYRLVFRALYYPSDWGNNPHYRGPLPLPPKSVWDLQLTSTARRVVTSAHDTVVVDYTFTTHQLTDEASPGNVEPSLATIGGTWDESFTLPTDPDLLLERTGYACMDEDEYPPNSVFEENTFYFFDDTCVAGSTTHGNRSGPCHITQFPGESCTTALNKKTGAVGTAIHFTRVPFDAAIADRVRVGEITNPDGADLTVVKEGLEQERRILYRYFSAGACELEEGVIAALGWRRLMLFSAIVRNDGTDRVHIGDLNDPTNPWLTSNVFEFSACHGHYHFSHYGTFGYNGAPGSKRAFCLEDTNRFHNDEFTPLTAEHQDCAYQGIGHGWGDEYEFGIPGQWVDITDVDATRSHDLTFDSNPDGFLCEGKPVLDASGNLIFDPTAFRTADGEVISKMRCDMPDTWDDNNFAAVAVSSPGGSYVTEACKDGQIGPLRNCGFVAAPTKLRSCTAGSTVTLQCTTKGAPQVLRLCERSEKLGVGVACTLADAPVNATVTSSGTQVRFACPAVRDAASASTGGYSVYSAALLPSSGASAITCTGW